MPIDWTDCRVALLTEMHDRGMTMTEIGRRLGVTRSIVAYALSKLGMRATASSRPTWPEDRAEQLQSLHAQGLPPREIGQRMGLSRNAVIGKLDRMGLTKYTGPTMADRLDALHAKMDRVLADCRT